MIDEMTAKIVAAYVAANAMPAAELPALIRSVDSAVTGGAGNMQSERPAPAVPVKKSVTDEYLICLEDGAKLKMLKRYLRSHYKMTPDQYRERWGLPHTYPMTCPAYTKERSKLAKASGLGRKGKPAKR